MPPVEKASGFGRFLCLTLILSVFGVGAAAQTKDTPPESAPLPKSTVAPVEIRVEKAGPRDMRRRVVHPFGGPREGCPRWRFEVLAETDGRIVFQVNEPYDHEVILGGFSDDNSHEVLLGDDACRFRVKIERSK
ncbi:MAG: hypothetical protein K2Y71_28725 [Xanthobacteraceae bacterium]|nr:hypothetical protein [Xanthobacteraceae bacterium]